MYFKIRKFSICLPDLLLDLEMARNEGTYRRVLKKYANPLLLIIDERLLLKPTENERKDIFELLQLRQKNLLPSFALSTDQMDGMNSLVGTMVLWLMPSWIALCMIHIKSISKALIHQKTFQCVRSIG
jgi:DNA replication protein DnaC